MITLAQTFDHEQLELFRDPATGLTGAVAIHSTALGPSMGGLRIRRYADVEAAAVDALRLARAMTLKNSAAGLRLGGGKAVLVDDGGWEDREARLLAFADVVERLGGRYVTAEDVGTSPADMDLIATRTRWVVGRSPANGGGGDPSPATARTVFGAIDAAVRSHLGAASLDGVHVGVLGAGKVGAGLVTLLTGAGAHVVVADVDRMRAEACAAAPHVEVVSVDGFLARELDVLAPCALGELIAAADVPELRCRIVAGAANNPLVDRSAAVALHDADILYVPDFIANCGGIVHVAAEFEGLDEAALDAQLGACVERIGPLLDEARGRGAIPLDVAVEHALERVAAARARV
ncbi:MAG: Glu/Leu/Phe/Val dehydrogenase dimerization domain-containing protein, partial [Conexibacter sp.]